MSRWRLGLLIGLTALYVEQGWAEQSAYSVRGVSGLPARTKIDLANSAEPLWYVAQEPSVSLREALRATCGSQGPHVDAFLESRATELNHAPDLEWSVEEGTAIAVPFCLKVEDEVPVPINEGDTVEGLLREHYGVYGPITLNATYALNIESHEDFETFSRHLQPGETLVLAHAAPARTFRPSPATPTSLNEIIESLDPVSLGAPLSVNLRELDNVPRDLAEFEYVRFVSAPAVDGVDSCALAEGEGREPIFDVGALVTRLAAEAALRSGSLEAIEATLVGLVDSGVRMSGDEFFRPEYFFANRREQGGIAGVDDDNPKNGRIDDVFGINFNTDTGRVAPYPTDRDADHGTKMASLILGGREFLGGLPDSLPSVAQLKLVNFSSSRPGGTTVPAVYLADAIRYLGKQGVKVVNLSLLNGRRVGFVLNAIDQASGVLFVVAAGNSQEGPGQNISHRNAFPARHGGRVGDRGRRVVTVGAHDRGGGWARFSNYSPEFVDLLAPGCAVEVRGLAESFELEHGTSVATAVVSFAASLLSALGVDDPQSIKNRLLAGVDVDSRLEGRAWTSGRLNIIKAISISHDVVELVDGEAYQFGNLEDRSLLKRFCGDEDKRANVLSDLVKVRPNLGPEDNRTIEYWKKTDGLLSKVSCPQIKANESIGQLAEAGGVVEGPNLESVLDIVFAHR